MQVSLIPIYDRRGSSYQKGDIKVTLTDADAERLGTLAGRRELLGAIVEELRRSGEPIRYLYLLGAEAASDDAEEGTIELFIYENGS